MRKLPRFPLNSYDRRFWKYGKFQIGTEIGAYRKKDTWQEFLSIAAISDGFYPSIVGWKVWKLDKTDVCSFGNIG